MREIHLPTINALVGRGLISAHADLSKKDGEWDANVAATGQSVDIRSLASPLDYENGREIFGALDFDFSGSGSASNFKGAGRAKVPDLSVMGVKLTDLKAPFWVTDGFVVVENSTAKAYGGNVEGRMAKDLHMSDWGGWIEIKSADAASAFKDIMPDSQGVIAGSADLQIRVTGDTRRTSMSNGEGTLEIKNGEISGFDGTEAVSKLVGGRPLRFNSLLVSFTVDGKTIYVLPGSRLSAPKGDPVFNYIMADGSVTMDKDIDLNCMGNINIRALNSFVGGMQGLISSAIEDGKSGLSVENFLGGAIGGFTRNEFRDVSLSVKSASGDISVKNVQIAAIPQDETAPKLNEAEMRREKEDERVRLKLEFPVGPGGETRREGIGGQVGGQVLQHILNDLLSF
jgi:hypothetical protein